MQAGKKHHVVTTASLKSCDLLFLGVSELEGLNLVTVLRSPSTVYQQRSELTTDQFIYCQSPTTYDIAKVATAR